jgi:hypothetical protein
LLHLSVDAELALFRFFFDRSNKIPEVYFVNLSHFTQISPCLLHLSSNTIYMDRALADVRQRGMAVLPDDVARLSPIGHEHVNVYGKYSFTLTETIQQGGFYPLREIDEAEGEEPLPESAETHFGA